MDLRPLPGSDLVGHRILSVMPPFSAAVWAARVHEHLSSIRDNTRMQTTPKGAR